MPLYARWISKYFLLSSLFILVMMVIIFYTRFSSYIQSKEIPSPLENLYEKFDDFPFASYMVQLF